MKRLLLSAAIIAAANGVSAQTYDVVIMNGRVMDPETGFDQVANIGVAAGLIAKITDQEIEGDRVIDATGHIVSPGFIDTHNHGAATEHGGKLSLRNGVTTGMDLEAGSMNIAEWYDEREGNWQLNYGTTVAQEFARMIVLDGLEQSSLRDMRDFFPARARSVEDGVASWSTHISTVEEMNQTLQILDQGLMEGALGIGSLVGYASTGITSREMFETQKVAANYGRMTAAHVRYLETKPPKENSIAGAEVMTNAFVLDAPLLYCHFNADNWPLVQELLVGARARGMNVMGEVYPYLSGSTNIGADFFEPEQWKATFETFENKVLDPAQGRFLTEEEIIDARENDPGRAVVAFIRPEEWVVPWIGLPGVAIAGDAMLTQDSEGRILDWYDPFELGAYHPRTSGTHGKSLRLARENDVPWMRLIENLSYNAAKFMGDAGLVAMQRRGRIQEGMIADITIFNPETVTENSDYAEGKNGLPTTGIPYVLVNGTVVVDDSKVLEGVTPGQEIRYPQESESRFEPLKNEGHWVLGAKFPH
ncbi:aminoacylase [Salipiger bermudensis]|uniref:amidohydrolase family protein n=1 Tax=Salipiger bermudensis TaxID=344736 RepID=UPI001C99FCBE|nr:amidohydrolase family protein [Salipiger bermudensis]MBY6006684.1 aminoacylase [Salipiger bermudensis]